MIGHYRCGEYEEFLAPADPASVERVIGHYNRGEYEEFLAPADPASVEAR